MSTLNYSIADNVADKRNIRDLVTRNLIRSIEADVRDTLDTCIGPYYENELYSKFPELIEDMVDDVAECSGVLYDKEYSDTDIGYAIGRTIVMLAEQYMKEEHHEI